ncbi:TetR/AcrR family transcriptional regulator [Streptomyces sp. L7]|uniref:TetR/AcrR family transcriptional regulator n=1 Tax=Streptomyces sp. L7 TaxID=3423954 RepID=UPI003D9856AF
MLDAILDATAHLVHRDGVAGLTMTALAEASGVGRATLYRYVPDVGSALEAWQQREVANHLQRLRTIAGDSAPADRLENVLMGYARLRSHRHGDDGSLHDTARLAPAEGEVCDLLAGIIEDAAHDGLARADIQPRVLAAYATGALGAAAMLPEPSAATRLAALVTESIRGGSRSHGEGPSAAHSGPVDGHQWNH